MNLQQIIILARKNIGGIQDTNSRFCLTEAVVAFDAGRMEDAKYWAIKSLGYSVGIFHADYQAASK